MEVDAGIVGKQLGLKDAEAENVANFINGLLNRTQDSLEESFALESPERPCGRSEGPCCGGKCG